MNPVVQHRSITLSLALAVLILLASGGLVLAFTPRENTIFPGVSVNGLYVGGLTGREAAARLNRNFGERAKTGYIHLQYEKKKWVIPFNSLGVTYDIPATVEEALKTGNEGSNMFNVVEMVKTHYSKPDLPLRYKLDNSKLDRVLAAIGSEINIAAQNASICMYYGKIKVLPAVTGRTLNISSTKQKIENSMGRIDTNPIVLDIDTHLPDITSNTLKDIKDFIGIGTTAVSAKNYETLKYTVGMLNGIVIKPGNEFSFNLTAGHGINENSYHNGIVIERNGKPVLAPVGAASQAASTLYKAVLHSGLKVTERAAHMAPPGYVSPGQDAAVVMGKLDFKFMNNTAYPIYIMAELKDNEMIIKLLGANKEGQTLQVIGRNEGKSSSGFTRYKVYRVYYMHGVEMKRELVSEDEYQGIFKN